MARPTARVLALLEILQNGGTRTAADLAGRLGVDERTVRRYVAHLLDLDVPVEALRGRHGGFRLARGYRLPPLMLNDDEAVAVLVGLLGGGSPVGVASPAAESAAAKVRRVLPRRLATRLAALLDVTDLPSRSDPAPPPEVDVLLLVAEAAQARRAVEIVHTGRTGRSTERTVSPYGVVAHAGHWYLTGLDRASGEVRTFRLDRVRAARLGAETFDRPPGFRPQEAVLDALARTPWRHAASVRVRAGALATITPLPDGWTQIELHADRLDWVPGVLAALDADLVVEGPDELRDRVRALGQRLLAAGGPQAT